MGPMAASAGTASAFAYAQGKFAKGDRIGCLLDPDAGSGLRCRPGFTGGVTSPLLVCAVPMFCKSDALPWAEAPEGAGEHRGGRIVREQEQEEVAAHNAV
jgi:hypothetical protein